MVPSIEWSPPLFFFLFDYASVVVFLIYCFLHVVNLHFVMLQGFQQNIKNAFTSHAELNVHRRPRGPRAGKWGCGEREWGDWFQLCRNTSGAARHPCGFFKPQNENFPWLQMANVIWFRRWFAPRVEGLRTFTSWFRIEKPRACRWLVSDAFDIFNFLSLPLHIKDVLTDISASDLWCVMKQPEWY